MFILDTTTPPAIPLQSQVRVVPNSRRPTTANDLDGEFIDNDPNHMRADGVTDDTDDVTVRASSLEPSADIIAQADKMRIIISSGQEVEPTLVDIYKRVTAYISNSYASEDNFQYDQAAADDSGSGTPSISEASYTIPIPPAISIPSIAKIEADDNKHNEQDIDSN